MPIKDVLKKYCKEEFMTEDVMTEVDTLFETAINEKTKKIEEEVEAKLEEKYSADLAEFKANLVEKLNDYVAYAVEEFAKENTPAIENEITAKMGTTVIEKLVGALKESYVEIPEESVDVVASLEEENKALKGELNEKVNETIEQEKQILEYEKAMSFKKLTAELSETDKEKVMDLIEEVSCDDIEMFEKKLGVVIKKIVTIEEEIVEEKKEEVEDIIEEDKKASEIDKYLPTHLM